MAQLATANIDFSPRRQRRVVELHEAEACRLAEGDWNRSAIDTGVDDLALTRNWMRRTGWACTFYGVDRRLLLRLAETPTPNGKCLVLGKLGTTSIVSDAIDEQIRPQVLEGKDEVSAFMVMDDCCQRVRGKDEEIGPLNLTWMDLR